MGNPFSSMFFVIPITFLCLILIIFIYKNIINSYKKEKLTEEIIKRNEGKIIGNEQNLVTALVSNEDFDLELRAYTSSVDRENFCQPIILYPKPTLTFAHQKDIQRGSHTGLTTDFTRHLSLKIHSLYPTLEDHHIRKILSSIIVIDRRLHVPYSSYDYDQNRRDFENYGNTCYADTLAILRCIK